MLGLLDSKKNWQEISGAGNNIYIVFVSLLVYNEYIYTILPCSVGHAN